MNSRDGQRLEARHMDALVNISKGIIADGVVNQKEAEFLIDWIEQTPALEGPVVDSLFERLSASLDDGFLDTDEAADLFNVLNEFVGGRGADDEFVRTWMPVDDPPPQIQFEGRQFMFTGNFVLEDRKWLEKQVRPLGGKHVRGSHVSRNLDYLVIGSRASDRYKHGNYGGKIEGAVAQRDARGQPAIVSEGHFLKALNDRLATAPHEAN